MAPRCGKIYLDLYDYDIVSYFIMISRSMHWLVNFTDNNDLLKDNFRFHMKKKRVQNIFWNHISVDFFILMVNNFYLITLIVDHNDALSQSDLSNVRNCFPIITMRVLMNNILTLWGAQNVLILLTSKTCTLAISMNLEMFSLYSYRLAFYPTTKHVLERT